MPRTKYMPSCCGSFSRHELPMHSLVLILLVCARSPARAQDYGTTDANELEALFEVLSGINSDTDWRSELPDPCNNWQQGIYCLPDNDTGDLHVTNLEFGSLSRFIDIIPCSMDASLHPSIGKFPYLQTLQIFGCFTNKSAMIPEEVGKLGELQILTLQDNPSLVGTLPAKLGKLSYLQRLSITQSGVMGNIPSELGSLPNLRQLDLSRNQLEGSIPASFNSLGNLQIMDLGYNSLFGTLPPVSGLGSLIKMVVCNNLLYGSIPSEVGLLVTLTYLDLSNNNFSGGIPPSFANLKNLEDLFVGHNNMGTPLPGFLAAMPFLSSLSLAQSNYTGPIPHEFGNMANIRVLVLKGNLLSGAIPLELGSLPHIYHLDLSRNNLTGPVPFSLDFVERMGTNLVFYNNTGLCFPHSTTRVGVATMGLNPCILEEPVSSNLDAQAESPSLEPDIPIHSSHAPARSWMMHLSISVLVFYVIVVILAA